MFEKFIVVVTQTTILFLMMVVGVFARRFKMFDEISIKKIADFVLIVITPCLIVKSFQQPFEPVMLKGVCWSFILALFSHFVAIISSAACTNSSIAITLAKEVSLTKVIISFDIHEMTYILFHLCTI